MKPLHIAPARNDSSRREAQKRPQREKEVKRKNNNEDKVNEDHNEFPGLRLCVGVLGCRYGAGHVRYRAGGSRRASLQRGHAKRPVSVQLGHGAFHPRQAPLWRLATDTIVKLAARWFALRKHGRLSRTKE